MSNFIVDEINNKIVEYLGTDEIVHIPEGIIEIDDYVFSNNFSVKEIYCPSTLQIIGFGAFEGCTALEKVHLNEGLIEFYDNAFAKTGFKSIDIPDSVNYMGREVFKEAAIETIKLPKSLKTLPNMCFAGSKLKEIVIPENITEIDASAFENCTSLEKVVLPSSLTSLGKYSQFEGYTFANCFSLKEITIPENIESILEATFLNCKSLEKVVFKSKELKVIEPDSFINCFSLKTIKLPTCKCLINSAFSQDIISKIYINEETLKENEGFAKTYKDQVIVYDSLDTLIEQNKSFSEINKIILANKEEIDKL